MLYVSFIITHYRHIGKGRNDYHDSIITLFRVLKDKPLFFVFDQEAYDHIRPHITVWDSAKIVVVDFTNTETYKRYYTKHLELLVIDNHPNLLHYISPSDRNKVDSAWTLTIWNYKFELLQMAYQANQLESIPETDVCYLDGGLFRPNRIHNINDFMKNDFHVKDTNTIVVNYSEELMNKTIDIQAMWKYGHNEIGINHMCFRADFLEELYRMFYSTLDTIISEGFVTTDQRVFTFAMRKLYKTNPSLFTFKRRGNESYRIAFSD